MEGYPDCSPPSYCNSLPNYSARASQSECVLLASQHAGVVHQPQIMDYCASDNSSGLPSVYRTSFKRVELNLGRRVFNSGVPVYGFGAPVEGFVEIRKHGHVSRVDVSLEGRAYAVYVDHGLTTVQKSYHLLSMKRTLYTSSSRCKNGEPIPTEPVQYPFNFQLPADPSLPITCTSLLPRIEARVWYYVRVDIYRTGLRTHISVQLPILYLPRTRPPPPPIPGTSRYITLSCALDTKLSGIDCSKWKTVNIGCESRQNISAQLSLPSPMVYPSGSCIPFIISLVWNPPSASPDTAPELSPTELAQHHADFLSHPVAVQLVKTVVLQVAPRRSKREYLLQSSNVWGDQACDSYHSEVRGGVKRYIRGTIKAGKQGGEVNWTCKDMIEIKYSIRLTINPCALNLTKIPTLTHDEPIQLTTHDWEPSPGTDAAALRDMLPAMSLRRNWR